jgi:hypothetical protein
METVDDLCTGIIHRILVLSVLERNQTYTQNHTQNNGNNGMNGNNGSTENNRNNKYSSDNQSDNKNQASTIRSQTGSSSSSSSGKSYPSNKHTQDVKAPLSSVTSFVAQWLVELRYPIMRSTEIECCVALWCGVVWCGVLCCFVLNYAVILISLYHNLPLKLFTFFHLHYSTILLPLFISMIFPSSPLLILHSFHTII